MRARPRLVAAALAVALLGLGACRDDGPGEGEARLEVDGRATVERAGGEREVITDRGEVGPGDRVELTEGTGVLTFGGGTRFELRGPVGDLAATILVVDDVPELESGDLLVASEDGAQVEADGTVVSVRSGTAKVRRALGMSVAVYDAEVQVDSAGQARSVPALRTLAVPALGRPQPLRPVRYDPGDGWDRRYLGEAIELGQQLERLAESYTSSLQPGEGRTPGFYKLILPGLDDEPAFTEDLIDLDRPPGETLVGAAIAELGEEGDFEERWVEVFSFRDAGAEWGLVALDQAVEREPLVGSVTEAIAASPLAFAPSGPSDDSSTSSTTAPTTVPSTPAPPPADPSPPTPRDPSPPPPPSPPPTSPPPTPTTLLPPPDEVVTPILDPVLGPVVDLVGGLLDGLLGSLIGGR